jgi:hypothetical protein
MRIKWLSKLSEKNDKCIERYVADKLIGSYRGINGLNILKHDVQLNCFRSMDLFYSKSIKTWRSAGVQFLVNSIGSVRNEIIFKNHLLIDNQNNTFPFFNLNNTQSVLPKYFRDLPVTHRLTTLSTINRQTVYKINRAFWNLSNTINARNAGQAPRIEDSYIYKVGDRMVKLKEITFKELYIGLVNAKDIPRPWERKWNDLLRYYTLDMDEAGWKSIWDNIHDNLVPYNIQSTIWAILHLNFYCGYKEKLLGYGDGKCKLCGEVEEGSYHIAINCIVLERSLNNFIIPLRNLNGNNLCKDEIAFGLAGAILEQLNQKEKLRNLVTFVIRTVVFKNRYKDFGGVENAVVAITSKVKFKMRQIFHDFWVYYRHKGEIQAYKDKYLIDNIFGSVQNGVLCLSI